MSIFSGMLKGVTSLFDGGIQSLFDAGKFKVEVRVERPNFACMHLASPYPGENGAITGFVIITCSAPATIRGFTLTHAVRSSFITVNYQAVVNSGDPQSAAKDAHKRIKKSKPVYKQEYVLFGSRSSSGGGAPEITVKPGQYVYPFSIPIENWVAGSSSAAILGEFSDCCDCCCKCCGGHFLLGGVLHSLDVKIIIANSFLDHNFDKEIEVQRAAPNEALSIPRPLDMPYVASSRGCCCGCCAGRGHIDLRIRLPRQDWVIGLDTNIVGKFSGRSNVPFQLVLLSTTKLSDKMTNKVDFGHREHIAETKIVRTAYKQHQAGHYDERFDGGKDFMIALPTNLAPSFGNGNANQLFHVSIVYTLVALPLDSMCSFEFDDPVQPIVLNMWKALAAPRPMPVFFQQQQQQIQMMQQQQQMQMQMQQPTQYFYQQPPPQANFAVSGEIPSFERVYAYSPPPPSLPPQNFTSREENGIMNKSSPSPYQESSSPNNLKFNPAALVTEMDLEPAQWGNVVQAQETIPHHAYQIPPLQAQLQS